MSLRVGLVVDYFIGSFKVLGVGVRSEVDLVSIKSGSSDGTRGRVEPTSLVSSVLDGQENLLGSCPSVLD
jgi:hypothetical protein